MKKKVAKQFEYDGLGFPVLLVDVPVCVIRGVVVPDIDYNRLQQSVLLELCKKPQPLTGNELRFIRQYLQMTLTEFAKQFGVTHPTVMNWEKSKNLYAKVTPTTEIYLRLYMLDLLKTSNKDFRDAYRQFDASLLSPKSRRMHSSKTFPICLSAKRAHLSTSC